MAVAARDIDLFIDQCFERRATSNSVDRTFCWVGDDVIRQGVRIVDTVIIHRSTCGAIELSQFRLLDKTPDFTCESVVFDVCWIGYCTR